MFGCSSMGGQEATDNRNDWCHATKGWGS